MRYLIALSFLTILALFAPSAPSPKAKPAPKPLESKDYVGAWRMLWGGRWCDANFEANGTYYCIWSDHPWIGTWHYDAKCQELTVKEHKVIDPDIAASWSYKMDSFKREQADGEFRLAAVSK